MSGSGEERTWTQLVSLMRVAAETGQCNIPGVAKMIGDWADEIEAKARAEREARDKAETENTRLRKLYENAVGNRERFGWTINHLLECEEALHVAEAEVDRLRAEKA